MLVLVTGATGFVGRWVANELSSHGHSLVATPRSGQLDIADDTAVRSFVHDAAPDAIVHLAGMSFAGDARRDPEGAFRTNVGGTASVLEAARTMARPPVVVVAGSSEVYGRPSPSDLPLGENAPLRASSPYGLSKLGQEGVAVDLAIAHGLSIVVARSFNHIGPGQRGDFVIPALTGRIGDVLAGRATSVRVGNVDVRRDFLDVRDVARAYRLLVEHLGSRSEPGLPEVVNVASGRSVSIREIAHHLMDAAGCRAELAVDPDLVRPDDPPDIVGDAGRLHRMTGWTPSIDLLVTLTAVVEERIPTDLRSRHTA